MIIVVVYVLLSFVVCVSVAAESDGRRVRNFLSPRLALFQDCNSSIKKVQDPQTTATSLYRLAISREQTLSYMICSCKEPVGSTSMGAPAAGALLAWLVYLT